MSSAKWQPFSLSLNVLKLLATKSILTSENLPGQLKFAPGKILILNRVHSGFTLYCMQFPICWSQWEIWESWWGSICPID